MTIADMKMEMFKLDKDQLLELNKFLCAEIRARNTVQNAVSITQFSVGDPVFFMDRGNPVYCVIDKVLRTNIDVTTDSGKKWRVAARALQKRN